MTSDSLRILTRDGRDSYRERYNSIPEIITAAPGRMNLIGEHTDYNSGYVLPMALDRWCVCLASPSEDNILEIASTQREYSAQISLQNQTITPATELKDAPWANALRGIIAAFQQRGFTIPPLQILLASNIPPGSGLASSAALAVAFTRLLETVCQTSLDRMEIALLCQKAEQDFAGVPCGIMDQYVCGHARNECALLIDCESLTHRHIPFSKQSEFSFLCIDSGIHHHLADGQYAARRQECEQAAKLLGIRTLRHAEPEDLDNSTLAAQPILQRRAEHVVTENKRTLQMARLLAQKNWQAVGRLMTDGHSSLVENYEVSLAELNFLVELSQTPQYQEDILGARLTGAGFGGSVIFLVNTEKKEQIAKELFAAYTEKFPQAAATSAGWMCSGAVEGAQVLTGN